MQNQYPGQGYPPNQQWNQQPAGQYNPPPPNQGWGQQQPAYGAPPPNQFPPQQGGWGQPHPQHSPQPGGWGQPAPQGQWGPPPPQGGYGAPPPNQYQAPPPQQGWGQAPPPQANYPPPAQPYGAPLPGVHPSYGSAPPQQPHGGPPPAGHFGPATQPSLGYGPMQTANIDMSRDVEALRSAMKGFGTNEKALIGILAKKDPIQINTLRTQYDQRLMKVLIKDLEKEASGYFGKGCVQIARGPLAGDCFTLYTAMKGMGTVEAALDDVLVGRSNADMNAIKTEYQRLFQKSLESDLRGDLSSDTEQMYMIIIAARRNEDSAPVLPHEIEKDVTELQRAMGGIMSKNSLQVCELLINKNDAQLRAISQAYEQRFRTSLVKTIKSKFSGHMEDALVLLIQRANNRADAEAIRLEESMAGLGTKDDLLVQRVVRCHWDRNFMKAVADAYKRRYGKSLVKRIEGETRGDYERLMVACVE